MVKYKKQSYKDLVLTVSKKEIHKVNILKALSFKFNNYFINLSIIGASHSININNEIYEVFAVNKVNENSLFSKNISRINNVFYSLDNFTYLFRLVNQIDDDNYDLEFNYVFPGENNPETRILLKRIDDLVKIYTSHYYPNEFITIYTETIVNFRRRKEII